jgi:hypothetical protein
LPAGSPRGAEQSAQQQEEGTEQQQSAARGHQDARGPAQALPGGRDLLFSSDPTISDDFVWSLQWINYSDRVYCYLSFLVTDRRFLSRLLMGIFFSSWLMKRAMANEACDGDTKVTARQPFRSSD